MDLSKGEKDILYGLFDALNQIVTTAPYSVVSGLLTTELYDMILVLFTFDQKEKELWDQAHLNNKFFHLASGASRRYYKEFAYAFVNDIISHAEARMPFLLYCVNTFKTHKAGDSDQQEKASAALFILALCEADLLLEQRPHIEAFCKSELLPLILDSSVNRLLRFRAVWIVETFSSFLGKPELLSIMQCYTKVFKGQ